MEKEHDYWKEDIKVILIGDIGVGKTNLIKVASGREFDEEQLGPLQAAYEKKDFNINGEKYTLFLWDPIGHERLGTLPKLFFKNSKIVIYVYDITNKTSFENLSSWDVEVKNSLGDDIIKGIVGNKQDLYVEEEVNEEKLKDFATSLNAKFTNTSAKNDPKGFSKFLEELLKDYIDLYNSKKEKNVENIKINSKKVKTDDKKKKKTSC